MQVLQNDSVCGVTPCAGMYAGYTITSSGLSVDSTTDILETGASLGQTLRFCHDIYSKDAEKICTSRAESLHFKDGYQHNPLSMGFMDDTNFGCCGVISSWEVLAGRNGLIELQVWRPEGSSYKLIGENEYTISGVSTGSFQTQTVSVPAAEQISVKSTDFIGWRAAGSEIVAHDHHGTYKEDVRQHLNMPDLTVGDVFAFSSSTTRHERFDIRAFLTQGQGPTLSGLPATVTVTAVISGASVFTAAATDPDTGDTLTFSEDGTQSGLFSVGSTTGEVLVVAATLPSGTYFVTIKVEDTCGLTDTGVLTVVVKSLSIYNLPNTTSVHEDITLETSLHTFWISYDGDGTVSCSIPTGLPFIVTSLSVTEFEVSVTANPNLSFNVTSSYSLVVTCSDGVSTESATLEVSVEQNTPPYFTNLPGGIVVSAKFTPSSVNVYNVTASAPPDVDSSLLTFTMTCSACPFTLQPDGQLSTTAGLKYANYTSYELFVYVSDSRTTTGPEKLIINITDVNTPPFFVNLPFTLTIPESTAVGTSIFKVNGSDADSGDILWISLSSSIQPLSGMDLFNLTAADGMINLSHSANIDYENLTSHNFTIQLSLSDGIDSVTSQLYITITDENEAPMFLSPIYNVSSAEGKTGTLIGAQLFSIADDDVGDTHVFNITGGQNYTMFYMNLTTGDIYFAADYDVAPADSPMTLQLIVQVTDSGGLANSAVLELTITHVNQPPTFVNLPSTVSIPENTTSGSIVYVVSANDVDGDALTISMTNTDVKVTDVWELSGGSVVLKSNAELDYETQISYNLTLTVTDGILVSGPLSLVVMVTDVNEPPIFIQSVYNVSTDEGKTGTLIGAQLFSIADDDVGDNHVFNITGGQNYTMFNMNLTTGDIYFAADYDVTPADSHMTLQLIVQVTDSGGLTNSAVLELTITHVNQPPTFVNLPSTVSTPENTTSGSIVYVVSANDVDGDALTIFMTNTDVTVTDVWELSGGSVVLKSNAELDYETQISYNLTLTVTDGILVSGPLSLVVMVTDVNEPPTFTHSVYSMSANEGKIGDALPTPPYTATDPSGSAAITYSILPGNHSSLFNINATTGILYYSQNSISSKISGGTAYITVRATNEYGSYSETDVRIAISPINTKPRVTVPAKITIQESHVLGWWVATVPIEDADGDMLDYRVLYHPTFSYATFNVSKTGNILNVTLAASLDYETVTAYNLTFIVNDGIEDSESAILEIKIEDVSEPPVFSSWHYNTTITENVNGTLVFSGLSVIDQDAGDTSSISIVSGNPDNALSMSPSGVIFFNVDYDVDVPAFPSTVSLVILAKDSTSLTATTVLTINIEDANDNAPVLNSNAYVKGVDETVRMGTTLFTVSCTDADSGMNSDIEYGLIRPSSTPDIVTISHAGEVILKQSLIAYLGQTFTFNISATDKGSPSLSTISMVTVIIAENATTSSNNDTSSSPVQAAQSSSSADVASASILEQPEIMLTLGAAAGVALASSIAGLSYLAWKRYKLGNKASKASAESATTAGSKNATKPIDGISRGSESSFQNRSSNNPDIKKPQMQRRPSNMSASTIRSSEFDFWNKGQPFEASNPGATPSRLSVASLSDVDATSMSNSRRWSLTSFSSHV